MSIDIDKNFPRFPGRKRGHRSKEQQREALAIMQKCLIDGESCKFAAYDAGFQPDTGSRFFKKKTGQTMENWRDEHKQHPQ